MTAQTRFAVAVLVLRFIPDESFEEPTGYWEAVMVARKDDPKRWSLPGGKLDPPGDPWTLPGGAIPSELHRVEGPRSAAWRELKEETGIDCRQDQLVELETVLDSGGYLTTFYILAANCPLPDKLSPREGEAKARWGRISELFNGPFGPENTARFMRMGIL